MPSLRLAVVFLRVGALAFGGLGATLALIERELVDRRHVITHDDVAATLVSRVWLRGGCADAGGPWPLRRWTGGTAVAFGSLTPGPVLRWLGAACTERRPGPFLPAATRIHPAALLAGGGIAGWLLN